MHHYGVFRRLLGCGAGEVGEMTRWGEIKCPRCEEADDLVQAAVRERRRQMRRLQPSRHWLMPPLAGLALVERRHPQRGKVMQWILLLIQMNASIADLHYVELYETLEQCTADLQEISPRLEPHEVMLCIEANN
jgi:hypothetical protein